jgi:hypothetical protein
MFHERGWTDDNVDEAALMRSAAQGCYICVSIWRRYSKFTNDGIGYPPRVEQIEYSLGYDTEDTFSLAITVYGAAESCVDLLCGKPHTAFLFYGVLQSGEYMQTGGKRC